LEYKLAEHTTVGMSALFSRYVDDFDRARNGTNGATIDTALSDPDPNFTVVNNAAYMGQRNLRESQTDTYNVRAFGTTSWRGSRFPTTSTTSRRRNSSFATRPSSSRIDDSTTPWTGARIRNTRARLFALAWIRLPIDSRTRRARPWRSGARRWTRTSGAAG